MMTAPLVKKNRRILVIDDNSAIQADFRKILGEPEAADAELDAFEAKLFGAKESEWFEIDAASQGEEGLAKVQRSIANGTPYAIAFVDVRMPPGWDGIETSRRIWEVDPYLQIVICTAYSDYSWDQMQEQINPGDRLLILKKPFDAIEVQQLANALTEKWRLAGEARMLLGDLERVVQQRTSALQQEMEERLKLEEIFRSQASLLDKARDAILVRDMDNRITYWNKSAEILYGWTAAEVIGRQSTEILRGEPTRFQEATAAVLRNGEWTGELGQHAKDGRDVLVESRWTLVRDSEGHARAVMSINTDIMEKKRMESHFLRSQRIESIGTLAGGIAHDLNNVLLPIILSIDLLRLSIKDAGQLNILASIESSARRGANMVQQVLSFARGVDGERHPLNPKGVVEDIRSFVQEAFPKNIEFYPQVQEDLPGFMGDATQVHQVLLNLFLNARDAMPDGGRLTLKVYGTQVGEMGMWAGTRIKGGAYIVFEITDTGTGISEAVQEKIFDPFFTTKDLGKGTGLGLSTVMAIVKSHDGFITVYSKPGNGTSFQVHFPSKTTGDSAPVQAPANTMPRGNGEIILLVDDEESVRFITQQTLQAYGYRVLSASDGSEAIAHYAEHGREVALVLTDMMMPVMDGPATIQVLKRMNPKVKIIAASGYTTDAEKVKAMGVNLYLHKPYTAMTVLSALTQVLKE
ncbi:PAS domain S-box-containing protein [Prosthecobacter fusiformis]|uniref:histidine kinase n=1 Tax=Prosthecobacter fusiformis TaxID=48464 RepID=A0A4R7RJV4_9BACT|nr:response regulator [Prosthecobacter fusiformis]TDU63186.1 PAS domain S-box-containing protein [Prosthecobacter fusiformis]